MVLKLLTMVSVSRSSEVDRFGNGSELGSKELQKGKKEISITNRIERAKTLTLGDRDRREPPAHRCSSAARRCTAATARGGDPSRCSRPSAPSRSCSTAAPSPLAAATAGVALTPCGKEKPSHRARTSRHHACLTRGLGAQGIVAQSARRLCAQPRASTRAGVGTDGGATISRHGRHGRTLVLARCEARGKKGKWKGRLNLSAAMVRPDRCAGEGRRGGATRATGVRPTTARSMCLERKEEE